MGKLFVVSTPIGNLSDITERALETLKVCDVIACEDSRVTSKLLQKFGISKSMLAYRDDNEIEQSKKLLNLLSDGKNVVLVSDAGTPALSDPGFRIIRECRKNNITIEPVPGACALITALTCSGLPTNGFLFLGFLLAKTSARQKVFEKYKNFEYTICFYESCHRIDKFLADAISVLGGERIISIAKELTKIHETFVVGTISDVIERMKSVAQKGEFVICIAPATYNL